MKKTTQKKQYVNRDEFEKLIRQYKLTRCDDTYTMLHPMLVTLVEMIIFKYTGCNNGSVDTNFKELEDTRATMIAHAITLLDTYDTSRSAFSYFYHCLFNDLINDRNKYTKLKSRETIQTELENDEGNFNESLMCCEPEIFKDNMDVLYARLEALKEYCDDRLKPNYHNEAGSTKCLRFIRDILNRDDFDSLIKNASTEKILTFFPTLYKKVYGSMSESDHIRLNRVLNKFNKVYNAAKRKEESLDIGTDEFINETTD